MTTATSAEHAEKEVTLYFKNDAGSDKVYFLKLMKDPENADLFRVFYKNGKRGKPLSKGDFKTTSQPYATAEKEFHRIIASQKRSGYTEDASGVPYQNTEIGQRFGGVNAQLLDRVEREEVMRRLESPLYIWQEKKDGERRPIKKVGDTVTGMQREGLIVPIPLNLADAVRALPMESLIIDGEDMGDGMYAAFDLLATPDDPKGQRPYEVRWAELQSLLARAPSRCWVPVPTASTPADAKALLQGVIARGGEGICGKLKSAPVVPGKGKDQFKFPFRARSTFFVTSQPIKKRSVGVGILDTDGSVKEMGRVTIPVNVEVPPNGAICDVEYLYAHRNGGDLHIPSWKGLRGDRLREHCTIDQLKYAPEDKVRADTSSDVEQIEEMEEDHPSM